MKITETQKQAYRDYVREGRGATLSDGRPITPMPIEDWVRIYGRVEGGERRVVSTPLCDDPPSRFDNQPTKEH